MKPDFITAYQEHVWRVFGFVAYRVNSRWEAEDLTQQTFERAFKSWNSYDERKASVPTWLLAIARNVIIDDARRRRSRPRESLLDKPLDLHAQTEGHELDLGISADLAEGLEELGERDRIVLALRFGGDLSGREIAEVMDLSVANVQQIISRSLRRLRDHLATTDHRPEGD